MRKTSWNHCFGVVQFSLGILAYYFKQQAFVGILSVICLVFWVLSKTLETKALFSEKSDRTILVPILIWYLDFQKKRKGTLMTEKEDDNSLKNRCRKNAKPEWHTVVSWTVPSCKFRIIRFLSNAMKLLCIIA